MPLSIFRSYDILYSSLILFKVINKTIKKLKNWIFYFHQKIEKVGVSSAYKERASVSFADDFEEKCSFSFLI